MTVRDIFCSALALFSEGPGDEAGYDEAVVLQMLNLLLPEVCDLNNRLRESRGLEELTEIPAVSSMADELGLEPEIERSVLPYGLAGKIALDDDLSKMNFFNSMYALRQEYYATALTEPVADVYGDR